MTIAIDVPSEYPDREPGRPLWLITLADLALLLVGFLVLVQATQHMGGKALAQGMREGFGAPRPTDAPDPAPLPVASAGMLDFTPGSASLPSAPAALIAWSRDAAADPRVQLTVTGSTDGSPADVDPATHSAAILASDRARAVAAAIAGVAPQRIAIATTTRPGRRAAMVTIAFVGEQPRTSR